MEGRAVQVTEATSLFEKNINKRIELLGQLAKAEDINFEKKKTIEMSLQELSEKRIEWAAMTENERLNLAKNTFRDLIGFGKDNSYSAKPIGISGEENDELIVISVEEMMLFQKILRELVKFNLQLEMMTNTKLHEQDARGYRDKD